MSKRTSSFAFRDGAVVQISGPPVSESLASRITAMMHASDPSDVGWYMEWTWNYCCQEHDCGQG